MLLKISLRCLQEPTCGHFLCQKNPFHTLTSYLFMLYFNVSDKEFINILHKYLNVKEQTTM